MPAAILDCTLRDGGYCNDWRFDRETARACYMAAKNAGCAVCEVGFRRTIPEKGVLYHCPEETMVSWFGDIVDPACKIAAMAQMGTFEVADFLPARDSVFSMVRLLVAYHSIDKDDSRLNTALFDETVAAANALSALGYAVSINVGRAEKLTDAMVATILDKCGAHTLYFADTYGALSLSRSYELLGMCKAAGVRVGFHYHNNREDANERARSMVAAGCNMIDGTMGGYGRGSGNTKLEALVADPLPVLGFVDNHLHGYQDRQDAAYQGYNVLYFITALFGFHVNYANELILDRPKRTVADIVKAFEWMRNHGHGPYYTEVTVLDAAFAATAPAAFASATTF